MAVKPTRSEQVVAIYKCLCDVKRLRIINLLRIEPQCVCHIEQVLGIGSVRTSQQLAYLRRHGMVEVTIRGTWRVYSLPANPSAELAANLACLQDCIFEGEIFREDLDRLKKIRRPCGPNTIQPIPEIDEHTRITHRPDPLHGQFMPQPPGGRHSAPCRG